MIPAERAHLNVTAVSHPGMTGKNNEDRYGVSAFYTDATHTTSSLLAVVADGIGGHRAGEVAAEIAVETVSAHVAQSDASQPLQTLTEALVKAGQAIFDMAEADSEQKGMGSTCAAVWIIGSRLYTAAVGDSRIYLIRDDSIRQLSTDHTWIQEAIEAGVIQPEQARGHPNAHVIRRYLGSRHETVPDFRLRLHADENPEQAEANQGTPLLPGDILVICSDGLTDLVENDEILSTLRTRNNRGALEDLVKLSNQRGGHDNVTIITLAVPPIERPTIPVMVRPPKRRWLPLLAGVGALLLVLAALVVGVIWGIVRLGNGADASPTPALEQMQTTLFPEGAAPSLDAPLGTPGMQTPLPEATLAPPTALSTTPQSATLTPWPTNTGAP